MTTEPDLLGQAPTPKTKHAPRAVINKLLEGARDMEGEAIGLLVKRTPKATDEAHTAMDIARSLTTAAKWLEEGK
jgi:hypothetical protein